MDNARSQVTFLSRVLGLEKIKQYRNKSFDRSFFDINSIEEESKEM
jgi:hypothetical protein